MKKILLPLISCLFPLMAFAQSPATSNGSEGDEEDEEVEEIGDEEEDSETEVRENPTFDFDIDNDDIDIPVPSFINQSANHINFNGADWTALRRAFANASAKPVTIVHIGDSHLQADVITATVRELLQYDFGNAGRGLITPLKISGTNQPSDYIFSSDDRWAPVRLMSRQWPYTMGFTGTSIHPMKNVSEITIGTRENEDYNPFSSFIVFHGGKLTVDSVISSAGYPVHFRAIPSHDYTQVIMASQETKVTVYFSTKGDLTLYGVSLSGNRPGVFYHTIGNNGATYATYNRIGNEGRGISPLDPQLVIISLGTNEAFGRISENALGNSIDRLVRSIRDANPSAQVLLVTPMECQRSVSRKVSRKVKVAGSRKGRKGKKRRRRSRSRYKTVTSTVKSYAPNANIKTVRNEIIRYGKDNGIPVLDWYEVAGGQGASNQWISAGLFSKDRIHHSSKGYRLAGRLLYDALIDALVNPNTPAK